MLEIVTLSCTVMSQRKYADSSASGESGERSKSRNRTYKSSHHDVREHKYSRNSSEDPSISSTRSDKHVSTNTRTHPRAELKTSDHSHSHRSKHASSNHVHNHVSPKSRDSGGDKSSYNECTTPNRKRSHESLLDDDIWTEHTSSSGRVYYYNKKLDKSQWERPKGLAVKKAKTDTTPDTSSSYSGRKMATTPAAMLSGSSSKHSSHSHSSHYHKDYGHSSSHRGHHRAVGHAHHSHDRKDRYDCSGHRSSSKRGSVSRSHSRSTSPAGAGKSDRGKYSRGGRGYSSSSRSSGHERSREKESASRHSKSEHTTPSNSSRVPTTTTTSSPCTPVLTNSSVVQTSLVSPCTPHTSTPLTNLHNTTPINSSRTPGSLAGQLVDQGVVSTSQGQPQKQLPYTPQQQQQASNGIYVQDPTMGGVGGVAVGFMGMGGVNLTSPQTVHMGPVDAGGLHPLQKAMLLQSQVQQTYAAVDPKLPVTPVAQAIPHHMTQQQSIPGSPLLQSPIPIPQHGTGTHIIYGTPAAVQTAQPLTQVYTVPAGTTPHATFDPSLNVSGNFVAMTSPTLRTPMSRLSYPGMDDGKFPDPANLEPVPASQVNMELFDRGLADPWNQYNNQIQQQIESCQLESLQRRTTETIFLSSKLARSWLRLETSQITITSKDKRLSSLRSLIEDISKS